MGNVILHSDLNCFYASVEMNEDDRLRSKPLAVCGSTEDRHGIVLAKSYSAKAMGVKTGQPNGEALKCCPNLVCVPPHFDLYKRYASKVRRIYRRYSTCVEPFGMDESWIGLACRDIQKGASIAEEIRKAVQNETGLTVSIGVSFSKIFAKLGSDLKKPNAITVIAKDNYREKIWPLDAGELLYVGRSTRRRLREVNIHTIGELALCDPQYLQSAFGKNGLMLRQFALGNDGAAVMPDNHIVPILSIGHGTTCVVDLETAYDVWRVLYALSQDLGHRLRCEKLLAHGVQLTVKDCDLDWKQFQMPLSATRRPLDFAQCAYALFCANYQWEKPVRALTVRAIDLIEENTPAQVDLFGVFTRSEKRRRLDDAVDEIRQHFGNSSIQSAALLGNLKMAGDKCETVPMPGLMYR